MSKPSITFIIQSPAPDLDNDKYDGPKIYVRGAVHALSEFHKPEQSFIAGIFFPRRVVQYVEDSFENGNYRAEILDGTVLYKFYRSIPPEIREQEESDTHLERFQKQKSGAGSAPYVAPIGGPCPDGVCSPIVQGDEKSYCYNCPNKEPRQ